MSRTQAIPRLVDRFSKEIFSDHDSRYHLKHKKTWIALVERGVWPCQPQRLSDKIDQLLELNEYHPRGKKLLFLRSRDKFTLLPSGYPDRPEEALERLIVQSNKKNMFGQMPIKGGKESIDIVRLKNDVGTFIELKPWKNSDSPLFAILEGLKNLSLFRFLRRNMHKGCNQFSHVGLAVLAPMKYYQEYRLLNEHEKVNNESKIKEYIEALGEKFQTKLEFFGLRWEEDNLAKVCSAVSPASIKKNTIVSVAGYPPIEPLLEKNWVKII